MNTPSEDLVHHPQTNQHALDRGFFHFKRLVLTRNLPKGSVFSHDFCVADAVTELASLLCRRLEVMRVILAKYTGNFPDDALVLLCEMGRGTAVEADAFHRAGKRLR